MRDTFATNLIRGMQRAAATKKPRKRTTKLISNLNPAKNERNWPIKAKVVYYDHLVSKCGLQTSNDGKLYFKCALEDESGRIGVIAYGKLFASSYHKNFEENRVVIIDHATLEEVNPDFKCVLNHAYQIRINKDIKWNHERIPQKRASSKRVCTTSKSKVRKLDTLASGDGSKRVCTTSKSKVRKLDTLASGDANGGGKLGRICLDLSQDLIVFDWRFFFRYLLGDESEVLINGAMLNNQNNVREQIHVLLTDWLARENENASFERITEALKEIGRNDLIQKYSEKIKNEIM